MEQLPIRSPSSTAKKAIGSVISLEPRNSAKDMHAAREMRVALLGNFAPRKCGIATFTTDVFEQLAKFHPEVKMDVYALQDGADPVIHTDAYAEVEREDPEAYVRAARQMNDDAVDAVWIQHEFGIFGGDCGEDVLALVERVAAPLIVTMHTVLSHPSEKQEQVARRLVSRASRIMVMCRSGRDLLVERYGVDADRVDIIEHGAPDRAFRPKEQSGTPRRTLMTFGLLGPGKGLETAIEALPAIVARHPEVVYRIAGVSHPNELRRNGEAYRHSLQDRAEALGIAKHIEWDNRFLGTDDLIGLLQDCDIYLTPYPNLQQSTSGTLSYAVALGRAVVSTPYIHARELLGDVGGALVPVGDAGAIADAVNRLLDRPEELEALQLRTYRRGRRTVWQHFAANTKALLETAIAPEAEAAEPAKLVVPSLAAFDVMCDSTGMLQHGKGVVPDRSHGYCLDDCVRALMLIHRVRWNNPGEELRRASVFASFLQHAWNADRRQFRNFMNFDRTWCEDVGSEDSNGRAIWALGDCALRSNLPRLRQWAREGFGFYAGIALDFEHPRSLAFAALGACALLQDDPTNATALAIVARCGDLLEKLLGGSRRPDWTWFEAIVGYDNPRLSQALIECGEQSGNAAWIAAGLDSLAWILEQQCSASGHFRAIGSETFGRPGDILPFDQQPLEAWAAIDACASAWRSDQQNGPQSRWLDHAHRAYRWFLGENDRAVVLGDLQFGSCLDGVTPHGANQNCGAESVLAFQLAYYGYEELIGFAGPDWRDNVVKGSRD
jgi:glycosyltransferase involved in cell wall biosynthesis